jgi:Ser/Thr protein kinase RdoA (MazF antagonist)
MTHRQQAPVLRSIFAPEALTSLVESAYGLPEIRLQLIKSVILDTYRVWSGSDSYILRIYPAQRRTLSAINAELEFLSYLCAHGAPVSIPVVQSHGERLLALDAPEGIRYAVLFTYAQGAPLGENLAAIQTYGRALAHIHRIADDWRPTHGRPALDLAFLLDRPLAHLGNYGQRGSDWAFLQQVADVIRTRIAVLPVEAPQFGYCHGDAGVGNAHVAADGQVTVFDFDFCGPGWRAYDLATFLSGESSAVVEAFLNGYQGVRRLAVEEHSALPLFQLAQAIWLLGTRASYINEWGEIHFSDRFIDRVLEGIRNIFARLA